MICPSCRAENDEQAEACFTCGKALHVLTQGTVLASRYEIVSFLGRGGMGRVYKAYDRVLEEHVAIKVLRPEFAREPEMARRFLSEIKLARKVSHPNVCRIHEYGQADGVRFISMEFVEGVHLKDFLHEHTLSLEEAYELSLQVARGLQAAHEGGIIHRDFKATNIMIDPRGTVRLMDFGIAKQAGAEASSVSVSGQIVGTPEYMSPEQARGERVGFRSDIYALGCVVFEIFTGAAPFRGETPLLTLFMQLHEAPLLEGEAIVPLPEPLLAVLRIALAKEPGDRFATVAEFTEALQLSREAAGLRPHAAAVFGRRASDPATTSGPREPFPETTTLHTPVRGGTAVLPSPVPLRPGPLRRHWPRALPLLLVAGVLAAVLGGSWPWSFPGIPRGLSPPAAPSAAVPTPLASRPPVTPVTSLTASSGRLPERAPSSPPRSSATPTVGSTAAPPPVRAPAVPASGTLSLLVVPGAEVTLDGRSLGTVSLREVPLSPGPHVVRILHPDYEPLQRKITIRAGLTTKLVLDLAEKGIRKQR